MYGNNYPNDYDDKHVIDSTARETRPAVHENQTGAYAGRENSYGSHNTYGGTGSNTYSSAGGGNMYGTTGSSSNTYGSTGSSNMYGTTGSSNTYGTGDSSNMYGTTGNRSNTYASAGSFGSSGFSRGTGRISGWRHTSGDQYGYTAGSRNAGDSFDGNGDSAQKKRRSGGFFKKAAVSVVLGLFFGACAGAGFYAVEMATGGGQEAAVPPVHIEKSAVPEPATAEAAPKTVETVEKISSSAVVMDVSDVAAQVMPAIVSINNTMTQTFSYFGRTLESESVGAGSGIIVGESDTELLIVSNFHVVQDADLLTVQFADGTEAEAQMKGSDPDMDLAVIAVDLAGISNETRGAITVAALGDSDSLTVGEPAIAIGNALGYGQSVTTGVVSALNRVIDLSASEDMYGMQGDAPGGSASFIQTDAAINPGNSGGALLNIRGEVIGINSNKIGGSAVEGMGYAIPISAAKPIIEELMLRETRSKVGEENKGFLGITSLTVVDQLVQDYGMPKGAYVSQVTEGSAAAKAGIMKGNIITGFDGNKIASSEDLIKVMEYYAAGDVVEVEIMQGSPVGWESKTVVVILGSRTE